MNHNDIKDTSACRLSKKELGLIALGLIILVLAAFEPVRHNSFVSYDDYRYITGNPHIQSGLTWSSVKWALTSGYAANWHPLTWISHMMDIELFGLNPLGHHLHNLFLHALCTVLLFYLLYKMTGAVWCSAFVALVFGIHPMRVESVAWAAERKDILCTLFWLLTIGAYLYYVQRGGVFSYTLLIICFALGLMAKPMLVTLPLILLLLDFWPLGRINRNISYLFYEKVPLFILVIISCVITYKIQQNFGAVTRTFSLDARILNALGNYIGYIGKLLWPRNLAMLYPLSEKSNLHDSQWPAWYLLFSLSFLITGCVLAVIRLRKQPYLLVGWLWYIITLIPVIGIVQIGSRLIADRYTYLPSIGIAVMATWAIEVISRNWPCRKVILTVGVVSLTAAMTLGTRVQTTYWKDSVTLYKHTLAVTQNNYVIHNSLGSNYLIQGEYDKAAEQFRKALQIEPMFPLANYNLGSVLSRKGKYKEAIDAYQKAIQMDPENDQAYLELAMILEKTDKYRQAVDTYHQFLKIKPDDPMGLNNLAWVLATAPDSVIRNSSKAVRLAEKACHLTNMKNPYLLDTLGAAYAANGQFKEAIETAQKAFDLANIKSQKDLADEIEKRLQLYKAGKSHPNPLN